MEYDYYAGTEVDTEVCEHGMSAWLCMGPNHYPTMQDEIEGRYF